MSWQEPKWIRKPRRSEETSWDWREPGGPDAPDDGVEPPATPSRHRPRSRMRTITNVFIVAIAVVPLLMIMFMRDGLFAMFLIIQFIANPLGH